MAVAVGYGNDGAGRRRGGAFVAALLVHALLLLLLPSGRNASRNPVSPSAALSVFDVAPPPPDIVAPSTPLPPPPTPVRATTRDGGSPDRVRSAPAISFVAPARQIELTAESLPVEAPQGEIALPGLAAAAASSAGTGTGTGAGDGEGGRGRGDGTGSGDGRAGLAKALWIRVPTPRELDAYWPDQARRDRIAGRVLLSCIVPRPGPPRRCRVIDEYPRNLGFGASAMRLSVLFRIQPVMRGSEVQNLPIIVPIAFPVPLEIKLPAMAR